MKNTITLGAALFVSLSLTNTVHSAESTLYETKDEGVTTTAPELWNQCGRKHDSALVTAGPQAPRDIDSGWGTNPTKFKTSFSAKKMNLCNIHYHRNAEHKSAAFSTFVKDKEHSGWATAEPKYTSAADRAAHDIGGVDHPVGVTPGDTIEVHWVHTSCSVNYDELDPSNGLGNCFTKVCANPQLRVVTQVFEVAEHDAEVTTMEHPMKHDDERVVYTGSTTGPGYNNDHCSPYEVTWDVKKTVTSMDAEAVAHFSHEMGEHGHGVRELVTRSELLSRIRSHDDHDD